MPKTWIEPQPVDIPASLQTQLDLHPLVKLTLVRRGFSDPEQVRAFLDPAAYHPAPASDLPDLDRAVTRLVRAIQAGEPILVWGDFDVDGQTSTTLLVEALRALQAVVIYHIPLRATEGHGIKLEYLQQYLPARPTTLTPKVLLTCDTGITAHEAVAYAQAQGVDVIITDHHELPVQLPPAYATVNPHRLADAGHPLATLPGVGVAYKLAEALYTHLGRVQDCESLLDLVALGIVADVATQTGDARYLLQRGLQVLRRAERPGLRALIELAELVPTQINEEQIGFMLGPRLNALGRLGDANPVVDFLTTQDPGQAQLFARSLDSYNERRKLLTEQITQAAMAQIAREPGLLNTPALVLAGENWHTGVVGIVASRLVERYGKPVILLNLGPDQVARGSARSVPGIQITEAIATQAALLHGYGGHAGAAGVAMAAEKLPEFRRGLAQAILAQLAGIPPAAPSQVIDAYLPLEELSLDLVDQIELLAPFGAGNPALTLATPNLRLVSQHSMGKDGEHLRLVVADSQGQHQAVLYWRGAGEPLPDPDTPFDLAYAARSNTYQGQRRLQLIWLDYRVNLAAAEQRMADEPAITIHDYRQASNPRAQLTALRAQTELQVWAEAEARGQLAGVSRLQLEPATALAVWSTPPGPQQWQTALRQVRPRQVYLFANDPQMDQPQPLLARLTGLAKHVINHRGGQTSLVELAAACAQREVTTRMALLWLEAKGHLCVNTLENGRLELHPGSGLERPELAEIQGELQTMLAESAAYRRYFARTDGQALLAALSD